jgi:hypothetical protein
MFLFPFFWILPQRTICEVFSDTSKKILFSSKKIEKRTILAGKGAGTRAPLALPCERPNLKI